MSLLEKHPIPEWLRRAFPSSRDSFLRCMATQLSAAELDDIANADYGYLNVENRGCLQKMLRTGVLPEPLEWSPRDVLHLTRWSEFKDGDPVSFHRRRAFACGVLVMASPQLWRDERDTNDATDSVQLLESLPFLARPIQEAIGCLLSWRLTIAHPDGFCDDPIAFTATGIVYVAAKLLDPTSPKMEQALEWLIALERERRSREQMVPYSGRWLIDLQPDLPRKFQQKWQTCLKELADQWPSFALLVGESPSINNA